MEDRGKFVPIHYNQWIMELRLVENWYQKCDAFALTNPPDLPTLHRVDICMI